MPFRFRMSSSLAVAGIVAFVAFVVSHNRGPVAYSTTSVATFLIVGLALGGIYAITALGLVVTYSTTGIFNFAHGAIGAFLAFLYWELRINRGWPAPLALVVVVLVVAPTIGVLLDRILMRRLGEADLVVQLMVTVGLMLAFMGVTLTIWKPNVGRSLPHFFEDTAGVEVAGITITWHRLITLAVALLIAIGLRTILRRTRTGIAMRAVVDNRPLAGLNGANPSLVSGAAWAMGCMTAAVAGILIASETGMVVENLTLVIVIAFAAAAIARLKSLPWAFVGGLVIGLARAFSAQFLSFDESFSFAPDAIPAAILLAALLLLPEGELERGKVRATARTERRTSPGEAAAGAIAMVGVIVAWANGWIPWFTGTTFGERTPVWLGRGVGFLVLGLIMLSARPAHRLGGPGLLRQLRHRRLRGGHVPPTSAGSTATWGSSGRLICAPLGVVSRLLPAARLKGLYLALGRRWRSPSSPTRSCSVTPT
ncbi:MAG: branched-chain amino acid ABC transporter permease [Acidimicrobiales bacterium]